MKHLFGKKNEKNEIKKTQETASEGLFREHNPLEMPPQEDPPSRPSGGKFVLRSTLASDYLSEKNEAIVKNGEEIDGWLLKLCGTHNMFHKNTCWKQRHCRYTGANKTFSYTHSDKKRRQVFKLIKFGPTIELGTPHAFEIFGMMEKEKTIQKLIFAAPSEGVYSQWIDVLTSTLPSEALLNDTALNRMREQVISPVKTYFSETGSVANSEMQEDYEDRTRTDSNRRNSTSSHEGGSTGSGISDMSHSRGQRQDAEGASLSLNKCTFCKKISGPDNPGQSCRKCSKFVCFNCQPIGRTLSNSNDRPLCVTCSEEENPRPPLDPNSFRPGTQAVSNLFEENDDDLDRARICCAQCQTSTTRKDIAEKTAPRGKWRNCLQCRKYWCGLCKHNSMVKPRKEGGKKTHYKLCQPCAAIRDAPPDPLTCVLCKEKFNMIRRRHRCNFCLKTYCGKCCCHKWKRGRVCSICFVLHHCDEERDQMTENESFRCPNDGFETPVFEDDPSELDDSRISSSNENQPDREEEVVVEVKTKTPFELLKEDASLERFFKMVRMGVPVDAVCQKMLQEGIDPEKIRIFALGHNLSEDDVNALLPSKKPPEPEGPNPAPKKKLTASENDTTAQQKNQGFSQLQMKRFYWDPLRDGVEDKKLGNTIWSKKTERSIAAPAKVTARERDEMARLFAARPAAVAVGPNAMEGGVKKGPGQKPKLVQLLEPRRSQNASIASAKFKDFDSFNTLTLAILRMDQGRLPIDRLRVLDALIPSAEEVKKLVGYSGPTDELPEGEQLMRVFSSVPRIGHKIKAFQYYSTFDSTLRDLCADIAMVTHACRQIIASECLARMLETILAIGNLLNQGSQIGSADGFSLDSLLKLSQTKSLDGTQTLLDYFIQMIHEKGEEDLFGVENEIPSLTFAYRLSEPNIVNQVNLLKRGYDESNQEYQQVQKDVTILTQKEQGLKQECKPVFGGMGGKPGFLAAIKARGQADNGVSNEGNARVNLLAAIKAKGESTEAGSAGNARMNLLGAIKARGQISEENNSGEANPRAAMFAAIKARGEAVDNAGADPRQSLLGAIKARGQNSDENAPSQNDPRGALFAAIKARAPASEDNCSNADPRQSLLGAIKARGQNSDENAPPQSDPRGALFAAIKAQAPASDGNCSNADPRQSLLGAIKARGQNSDKNASAQNDSHGALFAVINARTPTSDDNCSNADPRQSLLGAIKERGQEVKNDTVTVAHSDPRQTMFEAIKARSEIAEDRSEDPRQNLLGAIQARGEAVQSVGPAQSDQQAVLFASIHEQSKLSHKSSETHNPTSETQASSEKNSREATLTCDKERLAHPDGSAPANVHDSHVSLQDSSLKSLEKAGPAVPLSSNKKKEELKKRLEELKMQRRSKTQGSDMNEPHLPSQNTSRVEQLKIKDSISPASSHQTEGSSNSEQSAQHKAVIPGAEQKTPFELLKEDPNLERFFKMARMGLPIDAVCQKMILDRINPEQIRIIALGHGLSDDEVNNMLPWRKAPEPAGAISELNAAAGANDKDGVQTQETKRRLSLSIQNSLKRDDQVFELAGESKVSESQLDAHQSSKNTASEKTATNSLAPIVGVETSPAPAKSESKVTSPEIAARSALVLELKAGIAQGITLKKQEVKDGAMSDAALAKDALERFANKFKTFLPPSLKKIEETQQNMRIMKECCQNLAAYFCEEYNASSQEHIMSTLFKFTCLVSDSYRALLEKERKNRLKARRGRRAPEEQAKEEAAALRAVPRGRVGQCVCTAVGAGIVEARRHSDGVYVIRLVWGLAYLQPEMLLSPDDKPWSETFGEVEVKSIRSMDSMVQVQFPWGIGFFHPSFLQIPWNQSFLKSRKTISRDRKRKQISKSRTPTKLKEQNNLTRLNLEKGSVNIDSLCVELPKPLKVANSPVMGRKRGEETLGPLSSVGSDLDGFCSPPLANTPGKENFPQTPSNFSASVELMKSIDAHIMSSINDFKLSSQFSSNRGVDQFSSNRGLELFSSNRGLDQFSSNHRRSFSISPTEVTSSEDQFLPDRGLARFHSNRSVVRTLMLDSAIEEQEHQIISPDDAVRVSTEEKSLADFQLHFQTQTFSNMVRSTRRIPSVRQSVTTPDPFSEG